MKILFVDDDPLILEIYRDELEELGSPFEGLYAISGSQALELLKKSSFDLIFTDAHMPNMDGFELAKAVRSTYPQTDIVLITGSISSSDKSLENPPKLFSKVLCKPIDLDWLISFIRERQQHLAS